MVKHARFRSPRRSVIAKFRRGGWWVLLLALLAASLLFRDRINPPAPLSTVGTTFGLCGERGGAACVIDGDTVAIGKRRVRLTGYDAPELDGACEAERAKAHAARAQLHAWLAKGRFEWTGGSEPPYDRYGRELREARRGDELLADHMIEAGLAEGSGWGAQAVDWCS